MSTRTLGSRVYHNLEPHRTRPFSLRFPTRTRAFSTARFDEETDVLIVGSDAAGLMAALCAHSHGLRSLVIKKHSTVPAAVHLRG